MTVYFVEAEGSDYIKIGFTAGSAENRLCQLQTGQPQKLRLLGAIPGDRDAESGLHNELAEFRISGEWFGPAKEVRPVIQHLIDNQLPWFHCRVFRLLEVQWKKDVSLKDDTDKSAYEDITYTAADLNIGGYLKRIQSLEGVFARLNRHLEAGRPSVEFRKNACSGLNAFKQSNQFKIASYLLAWEGYEPPSVGLRRQ